MRALLTSILLCLALAACGRFDTDQIRACRLAIPALNPTDAVITIDTASLVMDWNNAAERMFGYTRGEALGQPLTELIIPRGHRPNHMGGIARYLQGGKPQILNRRVETRAMRRSGEEFDVEISVWPVRTAEGLTFSSFVRDISTLRARRWPGIGRGPDSASSGRTISESSARMTTTARRLANVAS